MNIQQFSYRQKIEDLSMFIDNINFVLYHQIEMSSNSRVTKFEFSTLLCSVKRMMSEDLGMQIETPATLPWYPPFCKAFKERIQRYDKFPSLGNWQMISVKYPEKSIEEAYIQHSPEQNLQEWGARVSQAMKKVSFVTVKNTQYRMCYTCYEENK